MRVRHYFLISFLVMLSVSRSLWRGRYNKGCLARGCSGKYTELADFPARCLILLVTHPEFFCPNRIWNTFEGL